MVCNINAFLELAAINETGITTSLDWAIQRINTSGSVTIPLTMVFVVLISGVSRGTLPANILNQLIMHYHSIIDLRLLTKELGIGKGFVKAYLSRPNHIVIEPSARAHHHRPASQNWYHSQPPKAPSFYSSPSRADPQQMPKRP